MASQDLVLVTGGTGYLAGWVISALIARGYAVRATVRSPAAAARLEAKFGADAPETAIADLVADAGWDEAMAGVRYVIHTATPMTARGEDLLSAARDGTRRVLLAAARAGVERVVLTSSGYAAMKSGIRPGSIAHIDETVWTDPTAADTNEYARAKTLAERDAWEIARANGIALTTILPGFILGPLQSAETSPSMQIIELMLKGAMPAVPNIGMSAVDVRDLAELHVAAMAAPAAAGERFLASTEFIWFRDIARLLRQELGAHGAKASARPMPDLLFRALALFSPQLRQLLPSLGRQTHLDHGKATRLLGFQPRPLRDTILEGARSLIARN